MEDRIFIIFIFNIYTIIIAKQKTNIFFGVVIKRGPRAERNVSIFSIFFEKKPNLFLAKKDTFYKNLYFDIKLRTSAFQKVAFLFTLSKLTEKWQTHWKNPQKLQKNEKNRVFSVGMRFYSRKKIYLAFLYLDNLYIHEKNLNEIKCEIKGHPVLYS